MAVMEDGRRVWNAANGDQVVGNVARGTQVDVLDATNKFWTQIKVTNSGLTGWVDAQAVDPTQNALGPIDGVDFALTCRWQGDLSQAVPHYLQAVASLRTKITDGGHGAGLGPYALTPAEWNAYLQLPSISGSGFAAADIGTWEAQVAVFAAITGDTRQRLAAVLGRPPDYVELYLAQIAGVAAAAAAVVNGAQTLSAVVAANPPVAADGIDPANQGAGGRDTFFFGLATATLSLNAIDLAEQDAFAATKADAQAADAKTRASIQSVVKNGGTINFASPKIPAGRALQAQLIATQFGAANYGVVQQIAAIANAIAESSLNPAAASPAPEQSYGLFQLNMKGVGAGHSIAQLVDGPSNIQIMLQQIATQVSDNQKFRAATTVSDAAAIFCTAFEKPANAASKALERAAIAQGLLA